jgi:hypothetical protein
MSFLLASRCPRLARARDEHLAERARAAAWEARMQDERLRLDALVAHRELQLVRSYRTKSPRYIAVRQWKLDQARALRAKLGA